MKTTIYHHKEGNFLKESFSFPRDFDRIAVVVNESFARDVQQGFELDVYGVLENAFFRTNHIDSNWTLNESVQVEGGVRARSSSVGDVFVLEGEPYFVDSFGFRPLEESEKE